MKISLALAVLFTALVVGPATAHDPFNDPMYPGIQAAEAVPGVPVLPNYSAAPFKKFRVGSNQGVYKHPELGLVNFVGYSTSPHPKGGESAVYVFTNTIGEFVYAEWHTIAADEKTYTTMTFLYTNGAWVFEGMVIEPIVIIVK